MSKHCMRFLLNLESTAFLHARLPRYSFVRLCVSMEHPLYFAPFRSKLCLSRPSRDWHQCVEYLPFACGLLCYVKCFYSNSRPTYIDIYWQICIDSLHVHYITTVTPGYSWDRRIANWEVFQTVGESHLLILWRTLQCIYLNMFNNVFQCSAP